MKIVVIGEAATQGSKRGFPYRGRKDGKMHVALVESSPRLRDWRNAVAAEARAYLAKHGAGGYPLAGPVALDVTFYIARPRSKPKRVLYPDTKPDALKLCRAVEDALSRIAYEDDARIVNLNVRKRYAIDSPPRAEIEVTAVS